MQYIVYFDQNGTPRPEDKKVQAAWNQAKIDEQTQVGADVTWPVFGLNMIGGSANSSGTVHVEPFYGDGSLEAWRLPESTDPSSEALPDPKGWRGIPDGLPDVINLDVGTFKYLFLAYNREGGPQINVVAMDRESRQKFDPTKAKPQKGPVDKYRLFPCQAITFVPLGQKLPLPVATVAQEKFNWEPKGIVLRTDPHPGSFLWLPESEDHVELTVAFKSELPADLPAVDDPLVIGQRYVFDGWEQNSLSNWKLGSVHQWSGAPDKKCAFDRESFIGVIAYYKLVQTRIPKARGKMYIPGPIDKGCPFNDLGIVEAGGRFSFNVKELAEGKVIARSQKGGRPIDVDVARPLRARIQTAASHLRAETDNRSFDAKAVELSRLLSDASPR